MNDITKNIQMDIVNLNNRLFDLESKIISNIDEIERLNKIIEINIEKEKILSLKKCIACDGNGFFKEQNHCYCCEYSDRTECTDCKREGKIWR